MTEHDGIDPVPQLESGQSSRSPLGSPTGTLSPTTPQSPKVEARAAKYGNASHIVYHEASWEPEKAERFRELVRPPVIRQWIDAGKIYREPSPREVPRIELFFDLTFVAVIHQLADAAVEEPSGDAVARFVLTFWPSWSIWEEARKFSNISGTDDVVHRVWVLAGMACIMGYSANASAIELHPTEEETGLDHTAVKAAAAFWLIIKLTRVLVLFIYAWRLPRFRISQTISGIAVLVPMFFYLPLIWVTSRKTQVILASLGIVVDLCRLDLIFFNIWGRVIHQRNLRAWDQNPNASDKGERPAQVVWHHMPNMPEGLRLPAMNIEHVVERSSAFVIIVLGELVMNLLYTAGAGEIGASLKYGRAVLGLISAWALYYMYLLPDEPNNEYEHPLRRSWVTGILFSFFHWPLCASLVLASAASGRMVLSNEVDTGVAWYWGCGVGFALLFMTAIDATHHSLLPTWSGRIPRPVRQLIGVLASIALILFPLGAETYTSITLLSIPMAILLFVLAINIVGILPRHGFRLKARRGPKHTEDQDVQLPVY